MSLQSKIISTIIPLIFAAVLGFGFWSFETVKGVIYDKSYLYLRVVLTDYITNHLSRRTEILDQPGTGQAPSSLKSYQQDAIESVNHMPEAKSGHFFAMNVQGQLVFSSRHHDAEPLETAWKTIADQTIETQENYGTVDAGNYHVFYYAQYFKPWGWVVFFSVDSLEINELISRILRTTIAVAFLIALLTIAAVTFLFRQFLVRPIDDLKQTASRIAKGDNLVDIEGQSSDEIGELATAFNHMTQRLISSNQNLEEKVRERTDELERQNELIALSMEASGLGTWEWNIAAGGQISWDDNIHRIFGYELGTFPGNFEAFAACIYEEDKAETLAAIQDALENLDYFETSYRIIRRDNHERRWISIKSKYYRNEKGETVRNRGICWDSTREKDLIFQLEEQQDELKKSEMFHRNIIEQLPLGMHMYELDEHGHLIFINSNPAADNILGIDNKQFVGKRMEDAFPNITETEVPQRFRKIAENGGHWINEDITYEDDKIAGVFISYNFQSTPGQIISLFQDITGQKQAEFLEQVVEKRTQELQRSNAELEQFAYVTSHDLQAPLRSIINFSQFIETDYETVLDEKGKRYLSNIVDAGYRMHTLISDLLDYSRVAKSDAQKDRVDCQKAYETALENLSQDVHSSGATIDVETPLPKIEGRFTEIMQVFQNLIGNAIKYTSDRAPNIRIQSQAEETHYRISIEDNGIGMREEDLERIFVIFQRLHTRDAYSGTGIGLALCKKIITNHGGELEVQSTLGQGSTFVFTLPRINTP